MDKYTKGFIIASLIYFAAAAAAGIFIGAGVDPSWLRFMHVHFNLLGFMSMMIYGVGYFILPRFNGKELRYPVLLPVHFYTSNAGLIGMVGTYSLRPSPAFNAFALLSGISIGFFVYNLVATLLYNPEKEKAKTDVGEKEEKEPIVPEMRVGEIFDKYPGIHEVFINNGFSSLEDPEHREAVKSIPVTVEIACGRHGVPLTKMIEELNEFIGVKAEVSPEPDPTEGEKDGALSRGDLVTGDHVLGDILAAYPETEVVFRKYYGEGCFSCPGQATESVGMSAMMHNTSESEILAELNSVVEAAMGAKRAAK